MVARTRLRICAPIPKHPLSLNSGQFDVELISRNDIVVDQTHTVSKEGSHERNVTQVGMRKPTTEWGVSLKGKCRRQVFTH
jgi:hypothetical protein